ncbi:MAG: hypothetical protein SF123_16535 [Chloroflexota bacterium]|nr:hypothetical protein [Chloroflexota bacterium]
MNPLQTLVDQIDQLSMQDWLTLRQHMLLQPVPPRFEDDAEAWIAELHEALAELREGLSQAELTAIVEAMNVDQY